MLQSQSLNLVTTENADIPMSWIWISDSDLDAPKWPSEQGQWPWFHQRFRYRPLEILEPIKEGAFVIDCNELWFVLLYVYKG